MGSPSVDRADVLVVEDDEEVRRYLADVLTEEGHEVALAVDAEQAIRAVSSEPYDLMLVDLRLPDGRSGLEVLRSARERDPNAAVVILTAHADVETAVEAMKLGALDYIKKPSDWNELRVRVRKCLDYVKLSRRAIVLEQENVRSVGGRGMVGEGPAMRELRKLIARVAPSDVTVLVLGETGTGKELVARALHGQSHRSSGPFVAVDCNIPDTLAASELFGVTANYAGMNRNEALIGRFEQAHGGTLFLDEVTELSPDVQASLLRALEERVIQPLGATEPRRVDVRVVAATNREMAEVVGDGVFRQDLYYRLKVMTIEVPPLRERKEDISLLAEYFVEQAAASMKRPVPEIGLDTMQLLHEYDYPGNVREVRNIMERAVLLSDGDVLAPSALPRELREGERELAGGSPDTAKTFLQAKGRVIEQFERQYLQQILWETGGVVSRAAQKAGINRKTLSKKLKKHCIRPSDFQGRA